MSLRETRSAAETAAIGGELAARLQPGDVVLVNGDLGAGKTTLIRGAARALGVTGPVASPTFTIGRRHAGSVVVSHLDLYRLGETGLSAEEPGLLDDYLTDDAIAFIEWPDVAADDPALERARSVWTVRLRHAGGDRREVEILAPAPPG